MCGTERKDTILALVLRPNHWGANKKRILPPEKMATTPVNKLSSIVSQVQKCMAYQRIEQIKNDAARLADEYTRNIGEENNFTI